MQTSPASPELPPDLTALSPVERWKRALAALRKVLANPDDTEQVLVFLGLINSGRSTSARLDRFFADPAARKLYDEHRAIDSHTVDLDVLAALPEGTLGHTYAKFLRSRGLTPEVFDGPPAGVTDPRLSYVIQRMRQTHDLWHVVTGCNTDPAGEIALQAFTFAQVRAPGNALLAAAGMLRGVREKPGLVRDVITLYRTGARARRLPSFAWEDHWATPLSEVRTMLGLPVEPPARAAA
ncbi:MAG TPA: Coq4 family protein [Kofleriaceae bacterium]